MKKSHLILAFVVYVLLASCEAMVSTQESNEIARAEFGLSNSDLRTRHKFKDFVSLDLSSHGFDVVLQAPKGARIIPHKTNLGITIYGGKYFKLQLKHAQGTAIENIDMMRLMATDKELNPSFDQLTTDQETGYIKRHKNGDLSFVYGVNVPGESVIVNSGMPYTLSPDKFTAYTKQDIQLMWKSANTIRMK